MKNFFFMGVGIALTCLVFYACDVRKQLKDVNDAGYICSNYASSAVNTMDKNTVIDMVRNYYDNQYQAIHPTGSASRVRFPNTSNVDSRAVFFSLDTLEKLIYYTRQATKNFEAPYKQSLGFNIYYASYPDKMGKTHTTGKTRYNYTNRHTLVFLPAIFENDKPADFDMIAALQNPKTSKPKFFETKDFTNPSILKIAGVSESTSTNMGSQNNGTGTPPPVTATGTGNPLLDVTDPF